MIYDLYYYFLIFKKFLKKRFINLLSNIQRILKVHWHILPNQALQVDLKFSEEQDYFANRK